MKGLAPDTQDETGRTGLHQAAVAGDADEVLRLLSGGANPNTQDAHLQTPVTLAAERGLYGVVKTLVEDSATDINLQDSFGRTPLHWCAKRCDVQGLEALLSTGKAKVNTKTTGGDTALHWACSGEGGDANAEGNFEERSLRAAEVLIGAGADVRAKNDQGETAQDVATNRAVMALLLSAKEEVCQKEEDEAAETERNRVAAAAEAKLSSAAGPGEPSSKGAAAWPGKQPNSGLAFSKPGSGSAVGTKKKIVIKLKKKP